MPISDKYNWIIAPLLCKIRQWNGVDLLKINISPAVNNIQHNCSRTAETASCLIRIWTSTPSFRQSKFVKLHNSINGILQINLQTCFLLAWLYVCCRTANAQRLARSVKPIFNLLARKLLLLWLSLENRDTHIRVHLL